MFIRKAERHKAKLRIGISGISGSGKTWSALEIASGMGGKIGMIDTEAGRGELYGSNFEYDVIRLEAPYTPERYVEAIKMFENGGYETVIIDSLSHAWVGAGGILSEVDKINGNSFTDKMGWRQATPRQNLLIETIITCKVHIITTFRVKNGYSMERDDRGKTVPRKVGMEIVQRDGVEYEYTLFMDINDTHIAHITKDNTQMFDQQWIKPDKEMGKKLIEWMNSGKDAKKEFEDVTLPFIVQELSNCTTLDDLQEKFKTAYRQYAKEFPEHVEKLMQAKDVAKDILERALPPSAQAVAIAKGTHYSQRLVQQHTSQGVTQ